MAARQRPGWTRLRGGCGGVWRHDESGWRVAHCGHPTALFPYYGVPPGLPLTIDPAQMLRSRGVGVGWGFRRLVLAQQAVEEWL